MRFPPIFVFALLQLQSPGMAAPTDSTAALEHSKRCMTQSEIEAFQAAWPANAGKGPELNACDEGVETTPKRSLLSASEMEDLVRRYLHVKEVLERSDGADKVKRCFTEEQIKEFQENWPPEAGLGPALVPCDPGTVNNDTFTIDP